MFTRCFAILLVLRNDRARFAAAIVGGWVALTPLVFPSTATTGDGELPRAA